MNIEITLPDESVRTYEKAITGEEIAFDIGPKLGKDAVAIEINRKLYDTSYVITENASIIEIELLWKLVNDVIKLNKISEKGFRIISNSGDDGNQDVPHFHVHLLGGKNLGRMIN